MYKTVGVNTRSSYQMWIISVSAAVYCLCRMAEIYEKGTRGWVLAWRAASFLLRKLLLLY